MSQLGSVVRINGLFHLLINEGFIGGYNPLILTNPSRNIQAAKFGAEALDQHLSNEKKVLFAV